MVRGMEMLKKTIELQVDHLDFKLQKPQDWRTIKTTRKHKTIIMDEKKLDTSWLKSLET